MAVRNASSASVKVFNGLIHYVKTPCLPCGKQDGQSTFQNHALSQLKLL
jgi:hypothetical protein